MFCEKCGNVLEDENKFCSACGFPVSKVSTLTAPDTTESIRPKKRTKRKGIVWILITAVILFAGGITAFCLIGLPQLTKVRIDTRKQFSVSISGYNQYAEITYGFRFDEDFIEDIQDNSKDKLNWKNESELEELLNSIKIEASKENALQNGDQIFFTFSYDKALEEELGVHLIFNESPYLVEGLKEVTEYDPFENLTITFTGYDYYGNAEIQAPTGPYSDYVSYSISNNGELYNGETIKVSAEFDEQIALEYGFQVNQGEKEYEVSGLTPLDDSAVFSGVDLRFAGATPKILASIENLSTDPLLSQIQYQLDRKENLSEGETVVVTATLPKRSENATANRTFTKEYIVELSTQSAEVQTKYLEDMLATDTDHYTENDGDSFIGKIGTRHGYVDHTGMEYEHGLEIFLARYGYKNEMSWVWNEYEIPSGYTRFRGTLTMLEESNNQKNFDTTLEIRGDGEVLYRVILRPGFGPADLDLDVSGVSKLTISATDNTAHKGGTAFLIADARLE